MSRAVVRYVPAAAPVAPAVHYIQSGAGELVAVTGAELAERRRTDQILYARWKVRQAQIRQRDAKVRRFWLGFGAVVGVGVLAGAGLGVWLVCRLVAEHGGAVAGLIGLVAFFGVIGAAAGAHRCVTLVQHWH